MFMCVCCVRVWVVFYGRNFYQIESHLDILKNMAKTPVSTQFNQSFPITIFARCPLFVWLFSFGCLSVFVLVSSSVFLYGFFIFFSFWIPWRLVQKTIIWYRVDCVTEDAHASYFLIKKITHACCLSALMCSYKLHLNAAHIYASVNRKIFW